MSGFGKKKKYRTQRAIVYNCSGRLCLARVLLFFFSFFLFLTIGTTARRRRRGHGELWSEVTAAVMRGQW